MPRLRQTGVLTKDEYDRPRHINYWGRFCHWKIIADRWQIASSPPFRVGSSQWRHIIVWFAIPPELSFRRKLVGWVHPCFLFLELPFGWQWFYETHHNRPPAYAEASTRVIDIMGLGILLIAVDTAHWKIIADSWQMPDQVRQDETYWFGLRFLRTVIQEETCGVLDVMCLHPIRSLLDDIN